MVCSLQELPRVSRVSSGLDNVALVGGVYPGNKFNGIPNLGVADELGGTETIGGEMCEDDA